MKCKNALRSINALTPKTEYLIAQLQRKLSGIWMECRLTTANCNARLQLIKHNQFDTVYHEHFSYLSLYTVNSIFEKSGLRIFDVELFQSQYKRLLCYLNQAVIVCCRTIFVIFKLLHECSFPLPAGNDSPVFVYICRCGRRSCYYIISAIMRPIAIL